MSSFSETDEGHYLITLTGLIRSPLWQNSTCAVAIVACVASSRRISPIWTWSSSLPVNPREPLLAALRGYFTQRGIDANWDAIKRLSDEMLVVTLAMVCPFEPAEKQALLEAPTGMDQAAALLTLLQMGALSPDTPGGRSVS